MTTRGSKVGAPAQAVLSAGQRGVEGDMSTRKVKRATQVSNIHIDLALKWKTRYCEHFNGAYCEICTAQDLQVLLAQTFDAGWRIGQRQVFSSVTPPVSQCLAVSVPEGIQCAYDKGHTGPHYCARTLRGGR